MDFDPQKLFIDVIDFFSILLPGALLTYLFKDSVGPHVLGCGYCYLHGTEGWVVFVFSSYLLGHFLFFIGSWLDDFAYDPLREMTNKEQITRLLNGRTLSPKIFRWLALLCFKRNADSAVDRVVLIKRDYLNRIDASRAVNAFQWCKARLATERPAALATINRFEADSKFFRSFVPVMLIVLGTAVYERQWPLAAGSIGAMLLAFVRYMEQRFKSTQHAYWNLLTLEASAVPSWLSRMPLSASNSDAEPPPPTHAGGVVVRKHRSKTEYLLLQATTDPDDWVLPKGHIELGEDARRCAIREVKEETGVWARIRAKLRVSEYKVEGKAVSVQFYLMEVVDRGRQEDPLRKHKWLSFDKALESTDHQEVKELLIFADQLHVV